LHPSTPSHARHEGAVLHRCAAAPAQDLRFEPPLLTFVDFGMKVKIRREKRAPAALRSYEPECALFWDLGTLAKPMASGYV